MPEERARSEAREPLWTTTTRVAGLASRARRRRATPVVVGRNRKCSDPARSADGLSSNGCRSPRLQSTPRAWNRAPRTSRAQAVYRHTRRSLRRARRGCRRTGTRRHGRVRPPGKWRRDCSGKRRTHGQRRLHRRAGRRHRGEHRDFLSRGRGDYRGGQEHLEPAHPPRDPDPPRPGSHLRCRRVPGARHSRSGASSQRGCDRGPLRDVSAQSPDDTRREGHGSVPGS